MLFKTANNLDNTYKRPYIASLSGKNIDVSNLSEEELAQYNRDKQIMDKFKGSVAGGTLGALVGAGYGNYIAGKYLKNAGTLNKILGRTINVVGGTGVGGVLGFGTSMKLLDKYYDMKNQN